jgi:hypothetical protein
VWIAGGWTPFAVQSALLGIPAAARTPFRLPAPERLDGEAAETVRDELREFAHLGGFTLRPSSTPWYGALLRTGADAQQAIELAGTLDSETLPMFAHRVAPLTAESGLRPRGDCAEQAALMRLYAAIGQTLRAGGPGNRLTSRASNRQPSRNNPRKASATPTNAAAVPWPATTRSAMPSPAAPSHAPRPAGDTAKGRRQARVASHPTPSPAKNGHAVDATPLSPRPSA